MVEIYHNHKHSQLRNKKFQTKTILTPIKAICASPNTALDHDCEIQMPGLDWHAELRIVPAVVQYRSQTVGRAAALGLARLGAARPTKTAVDESESCRESRI
jgi:hypothetical protein